MVKGQLVLSPFSDKFNKNKELKDFTEGLFFSYFRLDSALARQIFYTTTRLGIYKTITTNVK